MRCSALLVFGRGLRVEAAQPAPVEDKRCDGVVTVKLVHAQYDDVVVAGTALLLDAALEPRARTVEEHCTFVCGVPVEARETVAAATAQLLACLFLVRRKHTDTKARSSSQDGPRSRSGGDAHKHHRRLEGDGRKRVDCDPVRSFVDHSGQRRYAGRER